MYHEVSDIQKELATPSEHVTALFLPPVEVPHMYREYIPLTNSSKRVVSPPPPPPLVNTTPEDEELSDKICKIPCLTRILGQGSRSRFKVEVQGRGSRSRFKVE